VTLFEEAISLHRQGRLDDAVRLYQAVLRVEPDHLDSLHHLGIIYGQAGKAQEAIALFRRALALDPDAVEILNNLGSVFQAIHRYEDAIACHERARAVQPDDPVAHYNLGVALQALQRYREAIERYDEALKLEPNVAELHYNAGTALQAMNRFESAAERYERALALRPDYAEAHANLGIVLQALGHLEGSRKAYAAAVSYAPRTTRYHLSLAEAKRFSADDPQLVALEGLAREIGSLPKEEQMHLHFALGKAYGDVGRRELAFHHLLEGNALKRQQVAYHEEQSLGLFDRTRAVFSAELMREKAGFGEPSSVPIFILGMPRSGTTLIEQILASHPRVYGAGELPAFDRAVTALGSDGPAISFPEIVPSLTGAQLRQLGKSYLANVAAIAPEAARITDKMPANFRYVGLIHLALPNARIIHTQRDPIDTCLSCFSKLFAGDQPFAYDLRELGRYYRAYEQVMAHWRAVLPPGVMLEVRYEDVVADLESQARRIIAHAGLEWDDACLAFYKTQRPVQTASASQVRQPIYATSVGRWVPYRHLIQPLLGILQPQNGGREAGAT
jgi:tetratricopeptide (TPR) repeat protein